MRPLPYDGVGGHNEFWLASGRILEQLALGLHKHIAVLLKLEAVHSAGVGPIFDNCRERVLSQGLLKDPGYAEAPTFLVMSGQLLDIVGMAEVLDVLTDEIRILVGHRIDPTTAEAKRAR